jgi:phage baseplate assembly protein W
MSNYSPKLPLTQNPINGFENNQTVPSVVLQNLKMIVLTNPGERIMDPNFGVGIKQYLFEQNDSMTHNRIKARIINQVREYMPFVTIDEVSFSSEANNPNVMSNGLLVSIKYYIEPIGVEGTLGLTI